MIFQDLLHMWHSVGHTGLCVTVLHFGNLERDDHYQTASETVPECQNDRSKSFSLSTQYKVTLL